MWAIRAVRSSSVAEMENSSARGSLMVSLIVPRPERYSRRLMLKRLDLRGKLEGNSADRAAFLRHNLPRPEMAGEPPVEAVRDIIAAVRRDGDLALRQFTERFDHVAVTDLRVPAVTLEAALRDISPLVREALEEAYAAILAFHRSTKPEDDRYERDGVVVRQRWNPVARAGIYAPGGLAQYPSTVLMTAVPARVAGVDHIVLCVPPGPDGTIAPVTLAAAALAQVDEVYCIGGAQAIAAMAYGTESILPVDVIAGPGNIYVAVAKQLVAGVVGVPSSFAGPSEVVVVADETTPAEYAAIDLVVQAEHGPDGLAWLITWSEDAADAVDESMETLVARSPRRAEVEATLDGGGYAVVVDDAQAAMDVANAIAPEHLQIMTVDPEALVPLVRNAGAIFSGAYAPASVGDYLAGPSHVLPVYGSARYASALGVRDFLRDQHIISVEEAALARLAPHVAAIAEAEGLDAHARSVRMRLRP